jgi:hypothetical protein
MRVMVGAAGAVAETRPVTPPPVLYVDDDDNDVLLMRQACGVGQGTGDR